ncbi:MAG: tRNA 2-thiouridine(34) synthase MnmA [Thermodesulfovibrionales bacterium]|nr:tRNA 2-thiouridine(34) synthase MnmA [Thermodesulfovibrionales bacterium]
MPKVIVGMSGGVDSSTAAYLLKEQGYDVEGLSFILWETRQSKNFTSCCSLQAIEEAAKTASHLGIPHSAVDVRDDFLEKVIEPFIDAYTKGMTPNPCILCNKYIKFPYLMKEADKRGAEFIATGHYAKIEKEGSKGQRVKGSNFLKKSIDAKKDQSYFLYVLRKEELKRILFPLGDYKKEDVRRLAHELKLPAAQRPESQEICFIEGRNYFKLIDKLHPAADVSGPIMDMSGKILGEHKGIYHYTIGQRKGLGISSPHPLYVIKIDAAKNIVYAGSQEQAKIKEIEVGELNWLYPVKDESLNGVHPFPASPLPRFTVKIRSMMKDAPAAIYPGENMDTVKTIFDEPQWATAPGQSAVFYDEDIIIGGGVITQVELNNEKVTIHMRR